MKITFLLQKTRTTADVQKVLCKLSRQKKATSCLLYKKKLSMSTSAERIRLVKYSILQTTLAPSILCDIFVFVYFFRHWRKEIINAPHYHVTLCLLIVSFIQKTTDIIFHLYYLRWGIVISPTYSFCVTWNWLNYSLYCVNLDLVTWCCIERHLFVFHSHLMKKKLALIVFHYLPLTISARIAGIIHCSTAEDLAIYIAIHF
ncbi:unnamed protein product [Adineta ricciae]|uniref:Uncharacterized protein n=1 Tax=Adineta ricciae TaxID=249248 RepID=A0A813QHA4_ADIRI|nr:unnamed protein product [Adineta ricciae]